MAFSSSSKFSKNIFFLCWFRWSRRVCISDSGAVLLQAKETLRSVFPLPELLRKSSELSRCQLDPQVPVFLRSADLGFIIPITDLEEQVLRVEDQGVITYGASRRSIDQIRGAVEGFVFPSKFEISTADYRWCRFEISEAGAFINIEDEKKILDRYLKSLLVPFFRVSRRYWGQYCCTLLIFFFFQTERTERSARNNGCVFVEMYKCINVAVSLYIVVSCTSSVMSYYSRYVVDCSMYIKDSVHSCKLLMWIIRIFILPPTF